MGSRHCRRCRHTATQRVAGNRRHRRHRLIPDRIGVCRINLSVVPATFYGFASTFAYLSLVPGAFTINAMTGFDWKNAIVAVPISLLIGTGLGIAQGWLASVLAAGKTRAAPARPFASMAHPSQMTIV
jgi:Protein of unknown function (DUF1097)